MLDRLAELYLTAIDMEQALRWIRSTPHTWLGTPDSRIIMSISLVQIQSISATHA